MPPPIAQIDVQKLLEYETWTNRYLTSYAVGTAEAEALAQAIAVAEQKLYGSDIRIDRIRIATLTPEDGVYQAWDPNLVGSRGAEGNVDRLPLFNVIRIDFGAGLGRPSRKYIRGALVELGVSGDRLNSTGLALATTYATAIDGLVGIVDPQGDEFTGFSVSGAIGMRQLRRGTRRRSTPVLG